MALSGVVIDKTGESKDGLHSDETEGKMDIPLNENKPPNYKSLLNILEKSVDDEDFLRQYSSSEMQTLKTCNEFQVKLLAQAIKAKRSESVVDAILCNVTDIKNFVDGDYGKYLRVIKAVCDAEDRNALEKLLSQDKNIKLPEMVEIVDTLITELDENLFDNWFDFLYELKKFDVNESYDKKNRLLERALWMGNDTAIKKLCEAGAYLGFQLEKFENGYLIDKMEPQILEEIFDSCITSNNCNTKSSKFNINFNYKNFARSGSVISPADEMIPIMGILNSEELLHLLKHPLITSFMTLKFLTISKIFYLNFILFCGYGLSMVAYIIFKCERFEDDSFFVLVPWYCSILGIAYLILRESSQWIRCPKKYLSMPSNYLEFVLIALSIRTITMDFEESSNVKITAVFTILLMASELCLLVGYLPILSMSTHVLMLEEVLKSFFKSFSLYGIFVLMFSLCFYVLFGTEHTKCEDANTTDGNDKKDDYKLGNIFKSVVKTMAMVVGELDFENICFQGVFGYILFLLFVICMTVVLMNLLNGLAVSDIQTVKDQAELNELICRAKLLINHGSILLDEDDEEIKYKNEKYFFRKCSLNVQPNAPDIPNKVTFPAKYSSCRDLDKIENPTQTKLSTFANDENVRHIWDSLNGKYTAMGSSIVKKAIQILNKDKSNSQESQLEDIKEKVEFIEAKILEIYNKQIN